MRISANDQKIKRQTLIGRISIYASLAILAGGVGLSLFGQRLGLLNPENIGLFYAIYVAILIGGFALSRVGMHYGNRYLTPTRPERVLRDSLKGLDRKYALMLFQPPTDYFLVEPGGVTVFVTKPQTGPVTYAQGKWRRKSSAMKMFFGREEALGNPTEEATDALGKLNAVLTEKLPKLKIPQRAVVVFTDSTATLDVEPSPISVVRADDLKSFLRGDGRWKDLPNSIQRQMREALGAPQLEKPESAPTT